jgi:hypothetical protein
MEKELILLSEYCKHSHAEPDFILALESEGLIKTEIHNDTQYILSSQLKEMELFTRLYYDLSINIEGIDVIYNLLSKIELMEQELNILRRQS